MSRAIHISASLLLTLLNLVTALAFSAPPMPFPRPLHPGGFSLPPMVEDLIPIATAASSATATDDGTRSREMLRTDLLVVRPPDVESLWEWYAYTKRQTDADPSWGRIWPTALSLARFTLQCLDCGDGSDAGHEMHFASELGRAEQTLVVEAIKALRTTSHIVELGCGLGVAGLAFAASASAAKAIDTSRSVTFLDRDPYALHCVMASACVNKLATAPIATSPTSLSSEHGNSTALSITVRSSMDDWTNTDKNIHYNDLHLDALACENDQTLILASDILYEPSSMESLATKLRNLLHPSHGGFVLITEPERERTPGCRSAFAQSLRDIGGRLTTVPLTQLENNGVPTKQSVLVESDVDMDGCLAKTVLIVVHFDGTNIGKQR